MKIAIISSAHPEKCPYIKYYTDVLDSNQTEYEYLCWNRDNIILDLTKYTNSHWFNFYSPETNPFYKKLYHYFLFARFICKQVRKNGYDILIVHDIVSAIFLWRSLLKSKYRNKYIFDIRDYSPIYPYVRKKVKKIISNSLFTAISSFGYQKWLPKGQEYVLSHNIKHSLLDFNDFPSKSSNSSEKVVLTIGQIRNFSSNSSIIDALGNKSGFMLHFAGYGPEYENLKTYSGRYSNVLFSGSYRKENEYEIVKNADLINILLPDTLSFSTALSNRFYLSLIYKKPMIVNEESIQAQYVKEYSLGIVIKKENDIYQKLNDYINEFNFSVFAKRCDDLLKLIKNDVCRFENKIVNSIYPKSYE